MWHPFLFLSAIYWRLQGNKNVRKISGEMLQRMEPGLDSSTGSALFFPDTGVVCPHTLTIAMAENAVANGAFISFNTMVQGMTIEDDTIISVQTNRGTISPKVVVNAAGMFCEDIAAMANDRFFSIHPVKGTHAVIDKKYADELTGTVISSYEKVHKKRKKRSKAGSASVIRTVHGSVLTGPDALETINKEDFSTISYSAGQAIAQGKRLVPAINEKKVIKYFAGLNPITYEDDFIVSKGKSTSNIVHAAGIGVPGLTAAPAIAEDVADMVVDLFGGRNVLKTNTEFDPVRKPPIRPLQLSFDKRAELIASNPDYGIIVCRCENISKAEVIEVLNRNIRCETLDGVRRRVRPGMGRCQGGFCAPIIHDIIASEKRLTPQHIRKSGGGSEITFGSTKAIALKKSSAMGTSRDSGDKEKQRMKNKARSEMLAAVAHRKKQNQDNDD